MWAFVLFPAPPEETYQANTEIGMSVRAIATYKIVTYLPKGRSHFVRYAYAAQGGTVVYVKVFWC